MSFNEARKALNECVQRGIQLFVEGGELRARSPKGAMTSDLKALIGEAKADLIALLQQTSPTPGQPSKNDPVYAPLSFSQERLWFLDRFDGAEKAFTMPMACFLSGPLNISAMRQAADALVERHEALRTVINITPDGAQQMVKPFSSGTLEEWDLSESIDPDQAFRDNAMSMYNIPFDLSGGPLFRLVVAKLKEDRHGLLMLMHHIISDRSSMCILKRDLTRLYAGFCLNEPARLPQPGQFRDYAAWQRGHLAAGNLNQALHDAVSDLTGVPELLELPWDHPRPAVQSMRGAMHTFSVPAELATQLTQLGRQAAASPFMIWLGLFSLLLSRLSGQNDLTLGCPASTRRPEDAECIGFFINTIVLRLQSNNNPTFMEYLKHVRDVARRSFSRQELPFEQVVDQLHPDRSLDHNPLFQAMFVLQHEPALTATPFYGVQEEQILWSVNVSEFDLNLTMEPQGDGYTCYVEYSTELFDKPTIERWSKHLLVLARQAVEAPDTNVLDLPLLQNEERTEILTVWSGAEAPIATPPLLPSLLYGTCHSHVHKIAIRSHDTGMSFGELSRKAFGMVHWLAEHHVDTQGIVAVIGSISPEWIAGCMGIMFSGRAFLPLDPTLPESRLQALLNDAHVAAVVCTQDIQPLLPTAIPHLLLQNIEARDEGKLANTHPEDLAYIIYTSGSTGTPKGVRVSHASLAFHCANISNAFNLDASINALQFASPGFDVVLEEIWPVLAQGGSITICPPEVREQLADFDAFIRHNDVHLTNIPAPFWEAWAEYLHTAALHAPACLRLLVTGSDRVAPRWLEVWENIAPHCRFLSGYGPTEATITATLYDPGRDGRWADAVCLPLGRPLPGVQVYVLDANMQPVPPGCVGELCLAGAGVAMGYHNQPEATAASFVQSPFNTAERMYRTGDRVRFMPAPDGLGTLHFIGRTDHQIKRRGFRIEPGEIESVLLRHPDVEKAVAVSVEHGLLALVQGTGTTPSLMQYLAEQLPGHMVPDALLMVTTLPLLSGGKLDRRAAARMATELYTPQENTFEAPQGSVEQTLSAIWQDVLQVQHISRHANYFKLGGDSIKSLRVTGQARQHGLLITPRHIFQGQTLAAIASLATPIQQETASTGTEEGPIRPTPIQAWLLKQTPEYISSFFMPMPVHLTRPVTTHNLQAALEILFKVHPMLRLRIHDATTVPRLSIAPKSDAAKLASRAIFTGSTVRVTLESGPLFLAQQTASDGLCLLAHHACVDALSWVVIMEDLETLLDALEAGAPPELSSTGMSFPSFSSRLHDLAGEPELRGRLSFWQRECAGTSPLCPVCPVPSDTDTSPIHGVSELPFAQDDISEEIVLAAVVLAMHRIRGQKAWLVDLESHGRDVVDGADLTRTVGWFTNISPVRVDTNAFPAESPAATALLAARQAIQAARALGAEHGLLRHLYTDETIRTGMNALPDAPVLFNYLGSVMNNLGSSRFRPASDGLEGAAELPPPAPSHALELNALTNGKTLRINWVRDPGRIPATFVQAFLDALPQAVRDIANSASIEKTVPADFPLAWKAGLDPAGLRRIQRDYADAGFTLNDISPLTPLQKGMLFHTLLAHDAGEYFDQFVCQVELTAPATPEHLREAWEKVTGRHTALHASVHWQGQEEAMLAVAADWTIEWKELDWRDQNQEAALHTLLNEDRTRPFVLSRPSLQRLTLCRTGDTTYTMLWSNHHIILDGWSVPIVLGEVLHTANALASGQQAQLPSPPPFQVITAWQLNRDKAAAQAFWQTELNGFDTPTPLPLAEIWISKSQEPDDTMHHAEITLSAREEEEVQNAMHTHGWTLNSLIQGVWSLLLSRYGGGRDVCFGLTASGRPAHIPNVERVVGCCIETVPVRIRIHGQTTAADWLTELRDRQPEREAHAHLGIDAISRLSDLPRNVALFDSLVLVQTYPVEDIETTARVRFTGFMSNERTNYGLTLVATPPAAGAGSHLGLVYDHRRFDKPKAEQIVAHVRSLLLELVRHSDAPLDALEMLTDEELHRINNVWNGKTRTYPFTGPMQEIFEYHARRTPDAPAMEYFGATGDTPVQTLTYGELDRRANQLAHALQAQGVRPGTFVGLCLPRNGELLIGMLGSLKAGGAYVPLDPDYPRDRLIHMLDESAPPVTVTMEPLLRYLPLEGRTIDLCLDRDATGLAALPATQPPCDASPDDTAFLIYTSGSTGMPKGVKTLHRGMTNLVQMQTEHFHVTGRSRVMQFFSPSFDASTWEIVMALCSGGTVIMADKDYRMPGQPLYDLMERARVTHITLTPSSLAAVPAPAPEGLPHLECLITGGEGCDHSLAARWGIGRRRYYHGYGPTETTICCSAPLYTDFSGPMSLGKAHPNMCMHVLDDRLRPCPVGAVGEICIGGIGVTGGYLKRPELTAQRFCPDPLATAEEQERGARIYKSGDQGRWRPDGDIEFAGRVDHQVKVRGFRIELNEITAALLSHPDVAEAAVNTVDGPAETKVLGAWIVVQKDSPQPDPAALREFLRARLPEHAIPGPMGFIEHIPLTANGKLDRQALPPLLRSTTGRTVFHSAAEENMAAVWAEVLNLDSVGPEDNFFDLGGDSITSIRIAAKAMERGLCISVRDIFHLQTVAALAKAAGSEDKNILLAAPDGPVPITPIQHWYFSQPQPHSHYMQSMLLQLPVGLVPQALEKALDALLEQHAALRMRFTEQDGTWVQEAMPPTPVARLLQREDCQGMDETSFAHMVEQKGGLAKTSTDITTGRLFVPVWFDRGQNRAGSLLLAVHHLAVDTVSWRILISDLTAAYSQAIEGNIPTLPAATTPFTAWAQTLADAAQTMDAAEAMHWRKIASVRELPIAKNAGDALTAVTDLRNITVTMDAVETQHILSGTASNQESTAQELLLASFGLALGRWLRSRGLTSGETRITMEGHGRISVTPQINTDRTVGWFTAMYPFVLHTDEATPSRALEKVRETLRSIPENKAGYGMLRDLKADPVLKATPHAAINFNYLGRFDEMEGAWAMQAVSSGPELAPERSMPLLMDAVSLVLGGCMQLEITYPASIIDEEEARDLVHGWRDALRTFIRLMDVPAKTAPKPVAFLFTGQGSQYPGMTAGLYANEPVYREAVDALAPVIEDEIGLDPRVFLQTDLPASLSRRVTDTAIAQPLLYLVAHGLSALWHSRGVRPSVMLGHSIGELIAAGISGVFSAGEGARLACLRGKFMSSMRPGAMLAVPVPESQARALCDQVTAAQLAVINGPEQCVISGPHDAIDALEVHCNAHGILHSRLHTSHAFHSPMMQQAAEMFRKELEKVSLKPPRIPWASNLNGKWITPEQATDPAYWEQLILQPVNFEACLRTLLQESGMLLEIGPTNVLTRLASGHPSRGQALLVASQTTPKSSPSAQVEAFAAASKQLQQAGIMPPYEAG